MTQQIPPWVIQEREVAKTRKRRPKAPPKPKPKVLVNVRVSGSVAFELEGKDAAELIGLLKSLKLDEVIEFVDPWASGVELRYEVDVEDQAEYAFWDANETTGTIELKDPWRF